MITEDLVDYIKNQFKNNASREVIISKLAKVGWNIEDIEEGLSKALSSVPIPKLTSIKTEDPININPTKIHPTDTEFPLEEESENYRVDPYRESTDSDDLEEEIVSLELSKIEEPVTPVIEAPKIWTPSIIKPIIDKVEEIETKIEEEKPTVKPVSTRTIETFQKELNEPKEPVKVIPIKPIIKVVETEIKNEEIIPILTPKPKPISVVENKEEILSVTQNQIEDMLKAKSEKTEPVIKMEDIIIPPQKPQTLEDIQPPKVTEAPQTKIPDSTNSLSKSAMISSYSQDYMSASKLKKEVSKRKKNIFLKWLIAIFVIVILGGAIFVFGKSFLENPSLNIPFIKKDPTVLLLNNVEKFTSLKSYKVETEASISLPSFANISTGLVSGESVPSHDKDSFSLKAKGLVNKTSLVPSFFNYDLTFNSSMVDGDIKSNFIYDGISSYISVPNLDKIFGENSPAIGIVSVPSGGFEQFVALLPESLQEKAIKIDLLKVLPSESFSYIGGQDSSFFKDFTTNIEMIKKSEEQIHGINTYHYSVSVDRVVIKKFLNDISNIIFVNLSQDEKNDLEEIFGATSVSSFEVWIGKKDSTVYQYKFNLAIPLSKVIGLEDKGIANNEVIFSWQTTYYDLDVPNSATIPFETIPLEDFMKNVGDIKIKDTILSFTQSANVMKNAIGNYGKKSNSSGSCIDPIPGSLFSPLGHSKGASTVVGDIASTINSIINQTEGTSLCYSTSKAWAFSAPLISQPDSYFCLDSKGNSSVLAEAISGTVCE